MVQRIAATDPHPSHHRIGDQAEHLNGLAVAIRIRNRLQRQGAHRKQQVITGVDHFLGDGTADRNVALCVELIYDDRFAVNKSFLCQAVYGAACALIQQHRRSMLEKSDVGHASSHGSSPSKIGKEQRHRSRNNQNETQKETLDNKSHLQTLRRKC